MAENNLLVNQTADRETWGSRVGYIFSTLGMAIGVGGVWRFPMMTGRYGGGAFVLAFFTITIIIVLPAGFAESALGRKYGKSVVGTLAEVAGKKGSVFGYFMSAVTIGLSAYYPIILAMVVMYIFYAAAGAPFLADLTGFYEQVNDQRVVIFLIVVGIKLVTAFISTKGIQKGVERVCKIMLPLMMLFTLIVSIRVLTLEGISVGVKYYLQPDFSMLKSLELWMAAGGMALFAVGLGPGFLLTYGSYMDKKADLATDFLTVNIAQLLTCIMCGFATIPAVVLFGLDPNAGKGLLFQSLPMVFSKIPGGMIWFALFMIALFCSGLSSTIAQIELPAASFMDGLKVSRKKAVVITTISSILLAIPCIWSEAFFAFFDNLIGNVFYSITAGVLAIFLAWFVGAKKIREEWYNPTSAIKYGPWLDGLYKFVAVPAFIYFSVVAIMSLF